jgi:hypothetical protein
MQEKNRDELHGEVRDSGVGGEQRHVSVADEVWVATALLHREQPDREDFTAREIVARAEREKLYGRLRPGVYVHAIQHCVANRPPKPGRYRMLLATGRATRRLYRPGDPYDRGREGSKTVPARTDLPASYRHLLDWYEQSYGAPERGAKRQDPILALRGLGKEVWSGEAPDAYVERLRRGWE